MTAVRPYDGTPQGRPQSAQPQRRPQAAPGGPDRAVGDWSRRAPLLPALIFTIVLTQLPFVATLVISFMNWNAYYPDERGFAGLDNFRRVFTDENMRHSVIVTIELTATVVIVSLVLGMLIALLLDRKFMGRGAVRTMMIAPFLDRPGGRRAAVEARPLQPGVRPVQRADHGDLEAVRRRTTHHSPTGSARPRWSPSRCH